MIHTQTNDNLFISIKKKRSWLGCVIFWWFIESRWKELIRNTIVFLQRIDNWTAVLEFIHILTPDWSLSGKSDLLLAAASSWGCPGPAGPQPLTQMLTQDGSYFPDIGIQGDNRIIANARKTHLHEMFAILVHF